MTATTAKVYIVGYSVALDDKHIEKINKVLADVPVYSRYDDKGNDEARFVCRIHAMYLLKFSTDHMVFKHDSRFTCR